MHQLRRFGNLGRWCKAGDASRTQLQSCWMSPASRALSSTNVPQSPPIPNQVLAGLLVIELANVLAGPSVGQFAAELGATVIKVESTRTKGDVTRSWRLNGEKSSNGISAYFATCNSGKQSIALNLADPEGIALLHKLATKADVVVASYKPGDAEKLRVDAKTLQAINPSIIYAQITGYGNDDSRSGYDAVIQAETGFQGINGSPDGGPNKMPVALMDELAAHQLKQGVLLALLEKQRWPDRGPHCVNVSLFQAGVSALANQASAYINLNVVPVRMGSDHPSICPYGTVFNCQGDKPITLAIGSDSQFAKLCETLKLSELQSDPRFTTNVARVTNRETVKEYLAIAIREWDREDLLDKLSAKAVPAGAVNDLSDVFALPKAAALVIEHTEENCSGLRQTVFMEHAAPGLLPPPRYGQHTSQILRDVVGLSVEEIAKLASDNVVSLANES